MCLNVYLAQYFVYPHPAVAVPAYGAYLLAAEVEDEIAETCVLSQWRSRYCKLEVGDSSLVCVFYCSPHRHYAGVEQRVALAQSAAV